MAHQLYTVYHTTDMVGRMLGHCVEFVPVARVFSDNPESVFRFTNHGNGGEYDNWDDNPLVECLVNNPRSTSVGDYFVRADGMRFDVKPRGFSEYSTGERSGSLAVVHLPRDRSVEFR